MSKSRGWCFTINNPTEDDFHDVEDLKGHAKYYVFGREVGEQGTPHFQGYVLFHHARGLAGVKRLLRRAHLEQQRGSCNQAIVYCQKDGDWDEWGEKPAATSGLTTKERWRWIIKEAEAGNLEAIKEEEPGMYIRYFERLRSLSLGSGTILQGDLPHEWWYGPSGSGKSRTVWQLYPKHYQKELNKWWCGYGGEDVVVIEEWSPKNECTGSMLKIWADRYPFTAQIKGGSLRRVRPQKIIVLSNYTIDECFPASQDAEPIKRRFKVVEFPQLATQFYTQFEGTVDDLLQGLS